MTKNCLVINKCAGQSLLIDRGRIGAQAAGLCESGPMDEQAFLWANYLLANASTEAMFEICLGGLELQASSDCSIAITGADMHCTINGRAAAPWQSLNLQAGDVLRFAYSQFGNYAYLAIKGGFSADSFFQSKSCVLRENLGGHKLGQALQAGDQLAFAAHTKQIEQFTPRRFQRHYQAADTALHFIPCYQYADFPAASRDAFSEQLFSVSELLDRMGYRLHGDSLAGPEKGIISEAIALGSIQITPAGQAIVLMRDRQSIGGYPKIGTLASMDIEKLAQCKPGQKLRFIASTVEQSYRSRLAREEFFKAC